MAERYNVMTNAQIDVVHPLLESMNYELDVEPKGMLLREYTHEGIIICVFEPMEIELEIYREDFAGESDSVRNPKIQLTMEPGKAVSGEVVLDRNYVAVAGIRYKQILKEIRQQIRRQGLEAHLYKEIEGARNNVFRPKKKETIK